MRKPDPNLNQLSFDTLLSAADSSNQLRQHERAHSHLPGEMAEALPIYRSLIETHHAAMLAGEADTVVRLREEAHDLAFKLNGFLPGIMADEDSPGCVLDELTHAVDGAVPLWGQSGSFVITCASMRVRIDMDGIFGICASSMAWMGFGAHAVDLDQPFLSETGFRNFLGVGGGLAPGYTPDAFAAAIVNGYVRKELKGKLRRIADNYRGPKQQGHP